MKWWWTSEAFMKCSDRYDGPVPLKIVCTWLRWICFTLKPTFNKLRLLSSGKPVCDLGPRFFNEPHSFILTNLKIFSKLFVQTWVPRGAYMSMRWVEMHLAKRFSLLSSMHCISYSPFSKPHHSADWQTACTQHAHVDNMFKILNKVLQISDPVYTDLSLIYR